MIVPLSEIVGIDPPAPDSAEQPAGDSDTDAVGDHVAPDTEVAPKPSGKVTTAFSIFLAVSTASSRLPNRPPGSCAPHSH